MRYLLGFLLMVLALPCAAETYDLKIEIPSAKGYESFVKEYKAKATDEFVKDFNQAKAEGGHMNPWSLSMNGTFEYQGKFTVLAIGGYDYRGGAHGLPVLDVIFFDSTTHQPIPQSALYKDPAQAYARLSKLTRADLVKQGFDKDDEWMLKGSAPKAENFTGVVPTKEGVTVIFPSYQVASYAQGQPSVELTWDQLKDLFKAKYAPD